MRKFDTLDKQATVTIRVDGRDVDVPERASVAAGLLVAGQAFKGNGPLCFMGTCFRCAARVDGADHQRTCRLKPRRAMTVEFETSGNETGGGE